MEPYVLDPARKSLNAALKESQVWRSSITMHTPPRVLVYLVSNV